MNGNSIENINEISDGFVNLLLKKIKPFELDFSFDKMNFLREFLSDNGYLYIR